MKLGFMSDTHGSYEYVVQTLELLKGSKQICHLGDVLYHGPRNDLPETYNPKKLADILKNRTDIIYVRGNCDSDVDETVTGQDISNKLKIIDFDNYRFYLVHGYEETEDERIKEAKRFGCNVVVSGHSHVKVLKEKDGIIVLNPGSVTIPKDGTRSFAVYENGQIELWDLERQCRIKSLKLQTNSKLE
ncbi:MAG: phosphodiesterase [Bacillales bacterium]|jgi:putative phosphoesterase|nr:phosphodiesterase [Bacillales bacterium]